MSLQDPIADMLTRVRNALMARHEEVELPSSKMKAAIADVLFTEGYLGQWRVDSDNKQGVLHIQLKYQQNRPVIDGMRRVSKPSCRVYVSHDEIPKVMSGLGICILSTPRGIMSDRRAREMKVGGEILCEVW